MNDPDDLERLCRAARYGEEPADEDFSAVERGVALRLGLAAALGSATVTKAAAALGGTAPAALAPAALATGALAPIGVAAKASVASAVVLWLLGGAAAGGLTSWVVTSKFAAPAASQTAPALKRDVNRRQTSETARSTRSDTAPPSVARTRPDEDAAPVIVADSPARVTRSAARASVHPPSDNAMAPSSRAVENDARNIGDEARALTEVQRALRDGDADRALGLLGAMEARFGNGALGAERMAAHVLALCAAGRTEQGRTLSERFIALHPRSPLIERIRAACAR